MRPGNRFDYFGVSLYSKLCVLNCKCAAVSQMGIKTFFAFRPICTSAITRRVAFNLLMKFEQEPIILRAQINIHAASF